MGPGVLLAVTKPGFGIGGLLYTTVETTTLVGHEFLLKAWCFEAKVGILKRWKNNTKIPRVFDCL